MTLCSYDEKSDNQIIKSEQIEVVKSECATTIAIALVIVVVVVAPTSRLWFAPPKAVT